MEEKNGKIEELAWKPMERVHPVAVVCGIIKTVDQEYGEIYLVLKRGPNVRSAPNILSFVTGLHECGKTMAEQLMVEVKEETGMQLDVVDPLPLTTYEAIDWQNGYHWVITILLGLVKDTSMMKNLEPDKHEDIFWMTPTELWYSINESRGAWDDNIRVAIQPLKQLFFPPKAPEEIRRIIT